MGEVESYEHGIARASGYVFVVDDLNKHMFVKRPDRRTKLIPISSGDVIVNVIPESADVEQSPLRTQGPRAARHGREVVAY